jgi:hypothetical protein
VADLATEQDYLDYTATQDAPANMGVLLREASRMVRRHTISAVYAVDSNGAAVDQLVIDALRDATCAQAAAWASLNVDPLTGGVGQSRVIMNKSLDGAAITYANAQGQAQAADEATRRLVPAACEILRDAGLLRFGPWVYG